jgi:ATP synthase protein I
VVAGTLTWVSAQAWAQMKAKIFYIDPEPADRKPDEPEPVEGKKPEKSGHST